LARQNENHEAGNKYIPYGKMASWLVEWKNATETQWLKDSPSQPLQQSLKDLERAYKNFFRKRAAFPRFKKRGQNDAFRYPQGVKLDQENSRPVNSFQKNQKTLARLQRQLSRKVKFSNNWQKQKRKIQRLHSCIANIRRDYLHKVTT
ncbi:transposase, partial [Escherichia coli]|uniref:RNA-guided endonuclease InsQ/TnpB family protein n=1 Tax=Escherichia coli TaxID=562 RepID=UPI001C70301A